VPPFPTANFGPKVQNLLHSRQLVVDHAREGVERLRPGYEPAVDEKGGGASHSYAVTLFDVFLHRGRQGIYRKLGEIRET
jgi:hypothetical protein